MEGIYLLYIIPIVFIQTVLGQDNHGIVFPFNSIPDEQKTGAMVSVACTLTYETPSRDDAVYKWYDKDGMEITNGNSNIQPYLRESNSCTGGYKKCLMLNIEKVQDENSGKYTCTGDVNGVVYEGEYQLKVSAALKFTDCKDTQNGVLGYKSVIGCSATAGSISPEISWEKDGVQLRSDGRYQIGATSLTIINTTMEDKGMYKVFARSYVPTMESALRDIEFGVYTVPTIIVPILQNTAIVGRTAQFFCKAKGNPVPIIEWRKAGSTNVLKGTDRMVVDSAGEGPEIVQGKLEFLSVEKGDEAEYSCTATNEANGLANTEPVVTSSKLIVQTPPQIENTEDASGTEGGAANLLCEARGDPLPEIVWKKVNTQKMYSVGYSEDGISVTSNQIGDEGNPGTRLVLAFTNVAHEDAGEYECEAKNLAAVATKVVKLEVRYSPNFMEQKETQFYNWLTIENEKSEMTCTATANPEPVFEWYKNGPDGTFRQIKAGDNFFSIGQAVVNTEKPHESTSTLYVTFDGRNDEAVFGGYTCLAKNQVGSNNITLDMEKAVPPTAPQVTIDKEDARHIEFKLKPGSSSGLKVTHFKVEYTVKGSGIMMEQMVKIEERDFIDVNRQYTYMSVNDLSSNTEYVFTFFAKNAVDLSPGIEITRTTPDKRPPGIPLITSKANAMKPTVLTVQWDKPSDGGSVILSYLVQYRKVTVRVNNTNPSKDYELNQPQTDWIKQETKNRQIDLRGLIPGTYYQVEVRARNGKGLSTAGVRIFKMQDGDADGLSTGVIIGIVIGVFFLLFIIVDLTCYFKNKCGILMSIKEKVGGGREEGYAVAKTEEAENLAKKDELTEEVKAAEEGELAETIDDDKKAPLLSEEQKVDTIDEGETKPEKELEPEDKEVKEVPPVTEEAKPETPTKQEEPPTEPAKPEAPATEEKPATEAPQE